MPKLQGGRDGMTTVGPGGMRPKGGLADVERDLIRTRTAEGRSRAKGRGQHMGRPSASPHSSRPKPGSAAPKARR
jgi:DNA invertase Pin-like site-specific DNA recombinase